MATATILLVEDEKNILEAVTYNLEKAGFRAATARDGTHALELARRDLPDLILLDWMLPGMEGIEVCRVLKRDDKTKHIPIIMLTVKSSEVDKVLGLEMGADDYVTKPFSPRELVARVKAVLRRTQGPPAADIFQLEDLRVDWGKHLVTVKRKPVQLTAKEHGLLKALIEAKGRVLTRDALLDKVWGYERATEIETRTVDLHISQLRKKLGRMAARILTITNSGYRFVIDE